MERHLSYSERSTASLRRELEGRDIAFAGVREVLLLRLQQSDRGRFVPRSPTLPTFDPNAPLERLVIAQPPSLVGDSLVHLPHDLVRLIMRFLPPSGVISLMASARYFYNDGLMVLCRAAEEVFGAGGTPMALHLREVREEAIALDKALAARDAYYARRLAGRYRRWSPTQLGLTWRDSFNTLTPAEAFVEQVRLCIKRYGSIDAYLAKRRQTEAEKAYRQKERDILKKTSPKRVKELNQTLSLLGLPPLMTFDLEHPQKREGHVGFPCPIIFSLVTMMCGSRSPWWLRGQLIAYVFRGRSNPRRIFRDLFRSKHLIEFFLRCALPYYGPSEPRPPRLDGHHRLFRDQWHWNGTSSLTLMNLLSNTTRGAKGNSLHIFGNPHSITEEQFQILVRECLSAPPNIPILNLEGDVIADRAPLSLRTDERERDNAVWCGVVLHVKGQQTRVQFVAVHSPAPEGQLNFQPWNMRSNRAPPLALLQRISGEQGIMAVTPTHRDARGWFWRVRLVVGFYIA